MSKKLKVKLKPGKTKIKLKTKDGTALLPEAQMGALLGAAFAHAASPAQLQQLRENNALAVAPLPQIGESCAKVATEADAPEGSDPETV